MTALASEIRKTIIDTVGKNGGHLASNLGVVELTIALHRVFSSPHDAIIWDVSHQCYAHKLLTGRYEKFSTLRKAEGLSGFTKKCESEHDYFDNGHSSTSLSQALGLATSWDLQKKDGYVVAVIGDGALTGGMAYEAMSNAGQKHLYDKNESKRLVKNLIIIVNDNQMSIDQNTGALSSYLSRLTMTIHYQNIRHFIDSFVRHIPLLGKPLTKFIYRFKRGLKGLLLSNNMFSNFNFEYVGPLDGHDEKTLEKILHRVKKMKRPVVVHVVTKKGKGYSPAEDHPENFHGIGPFCTSDGKVEKFDLLSFTESFSNSLMTIAEKRNDIVCITAAMAKGTGLDAFSRHYPDRFFDVGIAEEHAVTFAAGLSRGGLLPIVCIYSTFMQRAVDQIIHDVALQNLAVIFILDRAGVVPNDGETHQGLFDISLFRCVPRLTIMSPATAQDLDECLNYAVNAKTPIMIRYPKTSCPSELSPFSSEVALGRGVLVKAEDYSPTLEASLEDKKVKKTLFVTTGSLFSETLVAARALLLKNTIADIYSLRFIKPFDENYFLKIAKNYDNIVLVEDNVENGGISEYLSNILRKNGIKNITTKAFPDEFFPQGTRAEILEMAGIFR